MLFSVRSDVCRLLNQELAVVSARIKHAQGVVASEAARAGELPSAAAPTVPPLDFLRAVRGEVKTYLAALDVLALMRVNAGLPSPTFGAMELSEAGALEGEVKRRLQVRSGSSDAGCSVAPWRVLVDKAGCDES